ncbi:hypothetical protein NKG94_47645 [Micromonospora sp. M12]
MARLGDRSARSGVLSWAAVLSAAAVLGTAVWAVDDDPVGDRTVGEVTRVGVSDGDSVPGYLRSVAADLAALPASAPAAEDGTYALVTLDAYLPPQRLTTVLGDVGVSAVFGRVPLPGRQTEIVKIPALRVPDDVVAGMERVAARKETEAADYRPRPPWSTATGWTNGVAGALRERRRGGGRRGGGVPHGLRLCLRGGGAGDAGGVARHRGPTGRAGGRPRARGVPAGPYGLHAAAARAARRGASAGRLRASPSRRGAGGRSRYRARWCPRRRW